MMKTSAVLLLLPLATVTRSSAFVVNSGVRLTTCAPRKQDIELSRRHTSISFSNSRPLHSAATTALSASAALPVDDSSSSAVTTSSASTSTKKDEKKARYAKIRAEGGIFAFDTPYGAMNPFGIYWGVLSISLGLLWMAAITACRFMYFITGGRVDRKRRIPIFFAHAWGTLLMRLSRSFPKMENREVLNDLYKSRTSAMFVANHNSWLDIPFLGATIGWTNYKIVAKKELEKVPILGSAIRTGGNVVLDRTNRRSQLMTLKSGIQWLKDGVHLCTFPEGTRTRTGRLMDFKNGAFKMAHKAGAPVVPLSIVGSDKAMPCDWVFPFRPSRGIAKVIVHEPIESEGKTEAELAAAVRAAVISGLPEDQRPLDEE